MRIPRAAQQRALDGPAIAYALSFDTDPGTASVAQGLHKTLRQFQRDTDKRGHSGLKSRLRHPANTAEKE